MLDPSCANHSIVVFESNQVEKQSISYLWKTKIWKTKMGQPRVVSLNCGIPMRLLIWRFIQNFQWEQNQMRQENDSWVKIWIG